MPTSRRSTRSSRRSRAVDAVWHLGDVVGYGPDPDGVVDRLRGVGATGVKGNHDAAAVGGNEIDSFNPDARRAMEWTRGAIAADDRGWLKALPETARIERRDARPRQPRATRSGSTSRPCPSPGPTSPSSRPASASTATPTCPVAFVEEDGRIEVVSPGSGSVLELRGRTALLNPGSVGQPRDGDPRSSHMILDTDRDTVTWHRTAYDIEATQAAMRAAGLPDSLAARLGLGL